MRFKRFLESEENKIPKGYRHEIPLEDALKLLKSHCGDALKLARPLYRGMSDPSDDEEGVYMVHAQGSVRKSANTTNHYTVIMDHFLPHLGYPKRSEAIIFTNAHNTARAFGSVFAIFPYDGVKIGVCAYGDLWDTPYFRIGNSSDKYLIHQWNGVLTRMGLPSGSYLELVDAIKEKMRESGTPHADQLIQMFGTPGNVESALEEAYSPDTLQLNLATTKNIDDFADRERELWTGGKCIAIKLTLWNKIQDRLEKEKAGDDK